MTAKNDASLIPVFLCFSPESGRYFERREIGSGDAIDVLGVATRPVGYPFPTCRSRRGFEKQLAQRNRVSTRWVLPLRADGEEAPRV